jgi:hypothetical protein
MVNWFNNMSRWSCSEIVRLDTPQERGYLIEKMIDVAVHLNELKNYNALMELLSGLNTAAISRLKETWACVSKVLACSRSRTTSRSSTRYKLL